MKRIAKCGLALSLACLAGMAGAEETGQEQYLSSCASCHGARGLGDGPLADLMTVPVPGLTGLAAANDGQFPMLEVIHTIDGRQGTRGHGFPMPVWGKNFEFGAKEEGFTEYSSEVMVRGQILSIAYYLETIQE